MFSCKFGRSRNLKVFCILFKSNFEYILTGPAKKIFKKKNIKINYKKIIDKSDLVITGTSYKSNTEFKCINIVKKIKKKFTAFLTIGQIIKYVFKKKKYLLPDKIIVCDKVKILHQII